MERTKNKEMEETLELNEYQLQCIREKQMEQMQEAQDMIMEMNTNN